MKKKTINIIIISMLLILVDILSKELIIRSLSLNESIILIKNFLKITYIKNTGAAFGILSNNILLLIGITVILVAYLTKELVKSKSNVNIISYVLIISGAFGNLIDRVFRKYVIDFISFTLFGREMAVFNIADTFITIGIFLLIFNIIKEEIHERNNSKSR